MEPHPRLLAAPVNTELNGIRDLIERPDGILHLPLTSLQTSYSPRRVRANREHVQLLRESQHEWPPILVQHKSYRIVDGVHRVEAAKELGLETIRAKLFHGDDQAAFLAAVYLNVSHGLPLSLPDRRAAALRILSTEPTWSDRAIAQAAGLDPKTVRSLRGASTEEVPQLRLHQSSQTVRIGRDGRRHPVDPRVGRQRASQLLQQNPGLSVRKVAQLCQISETTARDARAKLRRENGPTPASGSKTSSHDTERTTRTSSRTISSSYNSPEEVMRQLESLKRDPTLRYNEHGQNLLRSLIKNVHDIEELEPLAKELPPHCQQAVRSIAAHCAARWTTLAKYLRVHPWS